MKSIFEFRAQSTSSELQRHRSREIYPRIEGRHGDAFKQSQRNASLRLPHLLVDPLVDGSLVLDSSVLSAEPEADLLLSRLDRVGSVADVAADVNGKVTSDGAWG